MRKNKPAKCLHVGILSDSMYLVCEFEPHDQANINTLALCMLCSGVETWQSSLKNHPREINMSTGSHCF